MKMVKSGLLGNRKLIEGNENAILFQLTQIIKEHRALIIERLVNDIPTYLDFKFQMKPNKDQLVEIKDKLLHLQENGVNLTAYQPIIDQLQTQSVIHLTDKYFFQEIDDVLSALLPSRQLKIVH